jgi:16S rRNA (adenine1518-N6/adenine1519-N6)-dimethyltransferase
MAATHRFGQNFLISKRVREKILGLLDLPPDGTVWEIGPGLGAMTHMLVDNAARIVLFEIDRRFIEFLTSLYSEREEMRIVAGDVVKTWEAVYSSEGLPDRIMGNLPYNTAAMIIGDLLMAGSVSERMVFTVQKEVAARMNAKPSTREYSAFSVLCQFACSIQPAGLISPGAFYPRPHVDSAIVLMRPHGKYDFDLLPLVSTITKALFSSRRKTIGNTLGRSVVASQYGKSRLYDALDITGIDTGRRGEELPVETIVKLAECLMGTSMS